jgi:hypothetical protein
MSLNETTAAGQSNETLSVPVYESSEQERLDECYLLLARIASDIRPIVGGYRELCRALLARHGVTSSGREIL